MRPMRRWPPDPDSSALPAQTRAPWPLAVVTLAPQPAQTRVPWSLAVVTLAPQPAQTRVPWSLAVATLAPGPAQKRAPAHSCASQPRAAPVARQAEPALARFIDGCLHVLGPYRTEGDVCSQNGICRAGDAGKRRCRSRYEPWAA